jgi:hypothetical protein
METDRCGDSLKTHTQLQGTRSFWFSIISESHTFLVTKFSDTSKLEIFPFEIENCVKRFTEMGRGGNGHLQDVIGLLLIDADGNILRSTLAEVWSCQQPCSSLKSIFILLVLQSR